MSSSEALKHLDALLHYAMRLTHDVDHAEDLVQETYEHFLNRYGRKKEIQYMKALLFRIMHNRYVDKWRSRSRGPQIIAIESMQENWESHAMNTVRSGHDPLSIILQTALSDEMESALKSLKDEWRQTLILHEIEQFSYEEIGQIMDCSIGTVASRLSRARRAMAEQLQDQAATRGTSSSHDTMEETT